MDSFNSSGATTQPPSDSYNSAPSDRTPSDNAGISHPTTYESGPNSGANTNVRPSASEPVSAATLQGKTSTPNSNDTSTTAPSTSKKLDTETHSSTHHDNKDKTKSGADEDAEIDNKPRKDHETTTREIKATQEKAMAGTHPAEKEGEALRDKEDKEESKGNGPPSFRL